MDGESYRDRLWETSYKTQDSAVTLLQGPHSCRVFCDPCENVSVSIIVTLLLSLNALIRGSFLCDRGVQAMV